MLPNLPEFPVLYYGILRAGAVVVPMNPLLRQREIAHYVRDCDMTLLLAHQDTADEARRGAEGTVTPIVPVPPGGLPDLLAGHPDTEPAAARRDDDLAVILYTSGTTGVPKGAMLTHAGVAGPMPRNCASSCASAWHRTSTRGRFGSSRPSPRGPRARSSSVRSAASS
ncbi:AMP-binding protein [Streptomyces sp. SID1328]|uniref:AMP-binding protein n=1 Tax=Streptomyces sp. SID1328 TaxID=2690250 RepID=UPI00136CEF3C|nr:AMP-binding protein [Streptomyces sp. SID1328]MYV40377.1 AMP-binding protein [Streptomyces sp. SID1328]